MSEQLHNSEAIQLPANTAAQAVLALETDPKVARAEEVSLTMDPEGTLPEVDVMPDPDYPMGKWALVNQPSIIMFNGKRVGKCTLVSDNIEHVRWFNGIEVDEDERGKGYGSAAYKNVIVSSMKDGYDFRTHEWSQTEGAVQIWESLAEKGIARIEEPFKPDGAGRFAGSYVIDAVK